VQTKHILHRNSGICIFVHTVPQLGQDVNLAWAIKKDLHGLAEVAAKLRDAVSLGCPRRRRLW